MIASLVMLLGGWFAETDQLDKVSGFIIGMAGWLYILFEVFSGEASSLSAKIGNKASQQAFNTLRTIVSVGWSIYPLGYALAYLVAFNGFATNSHLANELVNVTYNLADLVNKGAFGLCVYAT